MQKILLNFQRFGKNNMTLQELKEKDEAPAWLTEEGLQTLSEGYLQKNETPKQMYLRVSSTAASRLKRPDLAPKFFDIIWNNWLCLASPVASNMGTPNLPISCYASAVPDSTSGIFKHYHEIAMMSKYGGGTGSFWGRIRGRNTPISNGGLSHGVPSWLPGLQNVTDTVSQASTRRGAVAAYLPIEHRDSAEFIDIRRNNGDISRKCLSKGFHHGVCISDEFMQSLKDGDVKNRKTWEHLLKVRVETGEPYLMFNDTANKAAPQMYKDKGLKIETSNLCSEIFLHTDTEHSFVCCLSSMNLARWEEWKDTEAVYLAIWFLDAVMEDFIIKAKKLEGLESAVRFAEKSRALGLGALGWHTLLQSKMLPFDSFQSMMINSQIFSHIRSESERATKDLAVAYGEPEWCVGYGVRNTHLSAMAPTVSNALISGGGSGLSEGIGLLAANIYSQRSAKGTFVVKNGILKQLLIEKGLDTLEIWNQINQDRGSVKNLKQLSSEEKEIFLTARETNQFALIRQAGQRQKFIDQGQSLNLYFPMPNDIGDVEEKRKLSKYIHEVHMEAWELGLKSLYYMKTESILKGEAVFKESGDCKSCEG
jgi:ribonucleoside-diphosphate reductase alpha chain